MKSGTNSSFTKLNQNKFHGNKQISSFLFDPFDTSDVKSSYTDVMKASTKKRVPFIEILNQQEQNIKNDKVFRKSSIGFIPENKKTDSSLSCKGNLKNKNSQNKTNENKKIKAKQSDRFTEQGKKSIQLISVIESVTYSSRSSQNKSSEIHKQKNYTLEINEQAVKRLLEQKQNNNINGEISICTTVGKTKTGKSFLLNKLISESTKDQQKTFSVNHTLASCTKGIWISNEPVKLQKNNSKKQILILDAAGFGSYDSTQQIDYKLLTLSILLSDVLMYNSIGPIDEQMLNGMSLAVQISKLISQQQQQSKEINKIFNFPSLFWVLRDFSLQLLTKQNKKISEEEYLEKCLNTQNCQKNYISVSSKTKSKVNIRQAIKSIFKNRKCSTLVVPFDQEGKIREEFCQGLLQIKDKLFGLVNNRQSQTDQNKGLNKIEDFIIRLRAFVELLNSQDSNNFSSQKKGMFSFPKIQSLETNLNRVKLLHEFKKMNEEYEKLFKKYQENIEKVQQVADSKERYLKKVLQLRLKMQNQLNETRIMFKQKIQKLLNIKNTLSAPKLSNKKYDQNQEQFSINFSQLQRDLNKNDNLFKVVKQNYKLQSDTLRLRFQQIQLKIKKSQESYRENQTQQEEKIISASKMISQKIESFRQICSLTELKKAFEKTLKDLKNLFRQSQELKQMKRLQKQLETHYLNQKVNLMEQSHLQMSNQSNFQEFSKLKTQGYESCTNCQKSFYIPYIIIPSSSFLKVKFLKTIVKEIHRQFTQEIQNGFNSSSFGEQFGHIKKMKLQFIIQVQLNNKKWFIRRKLKDFIELNNIISIMFTQEEDNMVYPNIQNNSNTKKTFMTSMLKLSSFTNSNDFSEEKVRKTKQQLQYFLIQLNKLDYVRNSRIFQKFFKINKEYLDL